MARVAVAVVVAMFLTYRGYLGDADPAIVLGFPVPTAFVVYGLWAFPYLFAAIFVAIFDRRYLPLGSLDRLRGVLGSGEGSE